MTSCSVTWCDRPIRARGLCSSHWARARRSPDIPLDAPFGFRMGPRPGNGPKPSDPLPRVIARLDRDLPDRHPDECWEWPGQRTKDGYGQIAFGTLVGGSGRRFYVHRLIIGAAAGTVAMHSCDNPPCVNPAHLAAVTQAENLADMRRKGRARNQWNGSGA